MAPGCFSGLWCFGSPQPSPCDDGIVSPVLTRTTQLGNGGVRDTAVIGTTRPHSRPSVADNGDIPTQATPTQDSQSGSTSALTPALTEAQPMGSHSPGSNVDIPVLAPAEEVPVVSPYRLDPVKAKEHIDRIPRFRILVMGRANAGKTTILQRVCNTTDQPEISNGRGKKLHATVVQGSLTRGLHDIEDELVFRSNPRFVFHDSCGFEAGGEEQFDLMKKFVMDRAQSTKLNDRIHAIWFCIPLTDSHRMVTACEKKFFEKCDTGCVPVILLATKADTLELEAIQKLEVDESGVDEVVGHKELEKEILKNHMERLKEWLGKAKFPPHDYLPLAGMEQQGASCTSLLTCTANALKEEGLQQLLISTQQSNLELCMEFAIMKTLKKCMSKHVDSIWPGTLAFFLALWFPYKHYPEFLLGGYQGLPLRFYEPEGQQEQFRVCRVTELFREEFEYYYGEFEEGSFYFGQYYMDDDMVPSISQPAQSLTLPTLSTSMTYSMQYIAEHGIGSILVFEYLYFLLQARNAQLGLQEHLTAAVQTYQSSGAHIKVNKLIQEAFQNYGEDVDTLCPILIGIVKENQLSKIFSRKE